MINYTAENPGFAESNASQILRVFTITAYNSLKTYFLCASFFGRCLLSRSLFFFWSFFYCCLLFSWSFFCCSLFLSCGFFSWWFLRCWSLLLSWRFFCWCLFCGCLFYWGLFNGWFFCSWRIFIWFGWRLRVGYGFWLLYNSFFTLLLFCLITIHWHENHLIGFLHRLSRCLIYFLSIGNLVRFCWYAAHFKFILFYLW